MAFKDLREFVEFLEKRGELIRVTEEVDPELEITEITDRVSKAYGPALLFENVKGSNFPLLINGFGSEERMALSLRVDSLDDIAQEIIDLLDIADNVPSSMLDKVKILPKLAQLASYIPKTIKTGPCQEVVDYEPALSKFPILKCWPEDAGKFITLPHIYTKNPTNGKRNAGMYRLQVFDDKTTGMHWHTHHDGAENYRMHCEMGKPTEVAVVLGGDPAITYAATAPLPKDIDELMFAGFLRKKPVELVKCKTIDMEVPADAEIVIEGYVDPEERRIEGPFGDHTGYYSLAGEYPVFHVTCITHRKEPIYPTTIVGQPPQEDCYMALATERIFLPLLKFQFPEIIDMHLPMEGVFHNCVFVSIKKTFPGHARKIMSSLWGMGQMMFAKFIIVVDEDVNVHNTSEVLWKVFNNVDPRRDTMIIDGPLDVLDHSAPRALLGSKMGIDATKKWKSEGHDREWPKDIVMSDDIKNLVDQKWSKYGID
ncbi:UbiD family decarboxylase associated with menaquinone via futalosine [Candidatus Syntrophocurvum alkaliphilum]|uniref:Phenolic acid decarboxylase n=1 Tax=Candidatus Syntrophocurvum alkaliphilum TaxID=2293317 RepID=A0A6I6D7G3_9FIRM|nr:menaquinone biosynthesis decarboxylase [Candidatus Syntrophocurvum alkaliphilum]QGT99043.1 UbiD family decarboxylase associated with menaquinone via futalosine [Candidatus Syntrophocurvum alkaliphilum]